ncbi:MAG: phasin family protein [Proteobacteria bacterium]|nr:phasin family protein [Pseudomonadota bacterium]
MKNNSPSSPTDAFEKVRSNMAGHMESHMQTAAENVEKASRDFMNRLEEAATFNRNHMEAVVQAGNIMAEGCKDVSQAVFNHIQSTMQNSMATGRAMLGVKTLRELMELQSNYMKGLFDSMMADSTKISEIAVRCTSEAAEPISASVTSVVEKIAERAKSAA